MATIFTKIVNGEILCYKIAEDEKHLAFLDVFPLRRGHVLVIPKRENDYIFDLEDQELGDLMIFGKKVAKAMDKTFDCARIGVSVIGLEVPHTHIHLIPMNGMADLNFDQEKMQFPAEEMESIAKAIQANL